MDTPTSAQLLRDRLDTLTVEAASLEAITHARRAERLAALTDYTAGLDVTLGEVQSADRRHRAALEDEQAHREAITLIRQELAGLELVEQDAALLAEMETAAGKIAALEYDMATQMEAAEREQRRVYLAQRETRQTIHDIRARGRAAGLRLIALRGGPDLNRDTLTAMEKIRLHEQLSPWLLDRDDALILPDPLFDVPRSAENSNYDHACRWSQPLALAENRLQRLNRPQPEPQAEQAGAAE